MVAENRKPRRMAYACYTEADYRAAERSFYAEYLESNHLHGQWHGSTVAFLNNWIVAMIKLRQHERAENLCRTQMQLMISSNMQNSTCFVCIECSLAASLFLSGHLPAAEELFHQIKARQGSFANSIAQDYFEVLSFVRLTAGAKDCLVFRDSGTHLSVLHPVSDYINQLDVSQPKKNLSLKSSVRSLRRRASMSRGLRQKKEPPLLAHTDRPKSLLQRLLGHDSINRFTAPIELSTSGPIAEPAIGNNPCPCFKCMFEEVLVPASEETALETWLGDPTLPEVPRSLPAKEECFDPSFGLTHRSIDTTTSSHGPDSTAVSILAITAWAADRCISVERQVKALLDTGAHKSFVSPDFADGIHAPINQVDRIDLTNPDGSSLEALGCIKVGFSWAGPHGITKIAQIQCYIVKDLVVGMSIGKIHIDKLQLLNAPPSLFGPIMFSARSKKEKLADERKSKDVAAARKVEAEQQANERAAERAREDEAARLKAIARIAAVTAPKWSPPPSRGVDSPICGSDTTAPSQQSSMTFASRSNTISTLASTPSLRTTTSSESQRPFSPSLSTASSNPQILQRQPSKHRRSDAQHWH